MGASFSIVNDTNTEIQVFESPTWEQLHTTTWNPWDSKNPSPRYLPPGQYHSSGKIEVSERMTVMLVNNFNGEKTSRVCWAGATADSNVR